MTTGSKARKPREWQPGYDVQAFVAAWQDLATFPSAQDVADHFGISRQAAALRARACRAHGVECKTRRGTNYFLVKATKGAM